MKQAIFDVIVAAIRLIRRPKNPLSLGEVKDSSPRIDIQTPSDAYLQDKMPTYNIPDLIEHLEFRIIIHEDWAGRVVQYPALYPPGVYGGYEFQMWAIEGYKNAIHYLKYLKETA